MRLWHKDLIPVLPRQQLLAQWRECCCIARNLEVNGTPNHILVNKVLNYSSEHFMYYCSLVVEEMKKRGYDVNSAIVRKCYSNISLAHVKGYFKSWRQCSNNAHNNLFCNWHNSRYFWQCYFNLQEKFDCGGISVDEWENIVYLADSLFPNGFSEKFIN